MTSTRQIVAAVIIAASPTPVVGVAVETLPRLPTTSTERPAIRKRVHATPETQPIARRKGVGPKVRSSVLVPADNASVIRPVSSCGQIATDFWLAIACQPGK